MRKKITKIIAALTVTAVMAGGISVPGLARTVLTTDAVAPSKGCMFVGLEGSYLTDARRLSSGSTLSARKPASRG